MAKFNGKRSIKLCYEEEPHALVKYLDRERNTDVVPVCNIPDLKAPDYHFDKKSIYYVFWAPCKKSKVEMLSDYRRVVSEIARFPAGSGNDCGPGFYPATILIVGSNKKDLLMKMEIERLREPSRKILDFMNATGERDREVRAHISRPKVADGRRKKHVIDRVDLETSESSDDSDPGVIPTSVYREEMKIQEQKYGEILGKYKKNEEEKLSLRSRIQTAEKRIEELESNLLEVLRLNIQYQKHILKCCRVSPCESHEGSVSDLEERNKDALAVGLIAERVEVEPKTSPLTISTPPVASSPSPALSTAATHSKASLPEEIPEIATGASNALGVTDTSTSVGDDSKVEIYPRIKICKEAFSCTSFRTFIENPLKIYKAGPGGDKEFLRDATTAMWTPEELANHTVTGKQSNANKIIEKALPGLCERRIQAILGALHRRVALEEEAGAKEGSMEGSVAGRVSLTAVKREIGSVMHNIKKRMKRQQGTAGAPTGNMEVTTGDL